MFSETIEKIKKKNSLYNLQHVPNIFIFKLWKKNDINAYLRFIDV